MTTTAELVGRHHIADVSKLVGRLMGLETVRKAFVDARNAMNAARPAIGATSAERALYDERYRNDHEAERALFSEALGFAADAMQFNWATTIETLAAALAEAEEARERLQRLAEKVDGIRDSIVGFQKVNWSEHIYPLVAALGEAGFEGREYEAARENAGTLIEQITAAEARATAAEEERDRLRLHLSNIFAKLDKRDGAPGHCHTVRGVWDQDNHFEIAGKPCDWCAQWEAAREDLSPQALSRDGGGE